MNLNIQGLWLFSGERYLHIEQTLGLRERENEEPSDQKASDFLILLFGLEVRSKSTVYLLEESNLILRQTDFKS